MLLLSRGVPTTAFSDGFSVCYPGIRNALFFRYLNSPNATEKMSLFQKDIFQGFCIPYAISPCFDGTRIGSMNSFGDLNG
uniref:Uncharacterized protein n=1 Tax=Candidatus Kentrum sp. LPFa TaxID=2126335 RepID=A0A450X3B6_9GAMM|nr:MAG: hypothetical protein BECKLPF1236A_GA0070988_1000727 [Candidatus Kentron sp. LPFa]VFK23731.1 MAG: hypothetical protein BECKLPF1236C_GA0070990_1000727 [Candidatus Kentron sp. LPFa]